MQFFKRSIDPLYTILGFGFLLCIVMCFVTMIQVGTLQEQVDQISSTVAKLSTELPSETLIKASVGPETVDTLTIEADQIVVSANTVSIQSEEAAPVEEVSEEPTVYQDQGLFAPSGLSADRFNQVIDQALSYYNRSPEEYLAYNLGETFVEIERTYEVNALYIIGITQRESGFNTSDNAKATNNLTSIMFGSKLKSYSSVSENLLDTARLLRNVYYNQRGLTNLSEVGAVYNPVNDTWAPKVQESVNLFYSLINTPKV